MERKLKQRLNEEGGQLVTNCHPLKRLNSNRGTMCTPVKRLPLSGNENAQGLLGSSDE